ncbi:MAG TPA: L,D-transpeptidase [Thermoanaerobaculia bacterium]|nr:L,D-transpeptidase [Thermoanaerobaculia bacterium]
MSTKKMAVAALLAVAIGCSREQAHQTKETVQQKVQNVFEAAVPSQGADDTAGREKERFDEQWRQLQSFRAQQQAKLQQQQQQQQAQQQSQAAAQEQTLQFVERTKKSKETFKDLDANAINSAPVMIPIKGDVKGPSVLKTQVFLDRLHFSVGSLDGRWGRNSAITVWTWQRGHGLDPTGDVDEATYRELARAAGYAPPVTQYVVTAQDVAGPFKHIPDDPYEKAKLSCLCYESLREELSERFHTTEDFLEVLNPDVKFSELAAGTTINVPNVRPPVTTDNPDIAKIVISIRGNSYNGFDAAGNLVFHAPTTVGAGYDPSPTENLHVVEIVRNPHFHYDPTLYHEVPDSNPDAHMNPGPNSPVGVVWMALSKEHYGMHGTNDPDAIGYASSHGCVRLTNWDAEEVSHRIAKGVPVSFVDTKHGG